MQFGWNLIGFMESLSIVLPQDNGTVETGNHIPSKLLHSLLLQGRYMVVRSPRGGVPPDEWRTLPPGGNWDRLGGFYRQSTIAMVSMSDGLPKAKCLKRGAKLCLGSLRYGSRLENPFNILIKYC